MLTVVGGNVWERRENRRCARSGVWLWQGYMGIVTCQWGWGYRRRSCNFSLFGKCFDCYDNVLVCSYLPIDLQINTIRLLTRAFTSNKSNQQTISLSRNVQAEKANWEDGGVSGNAGSQRERQREWQGSGWDWESPCTVWVECNRRVQPTMYANSLLSEGGTNTLSIARCACRILPTG